jgi:hypothetical protein
MNFKEWLSKQQSDTLDNFQFVVTNEKNEDGKDIIMISLFDSTKHPDLYENEKPKPLGNVEFRTDINPTCINNAWLEPQLRNKKIGTTLYEIALELATQNKQGVMPCASIDEDDTSANAYRVWNSIFKNRQDIIATPIETWTKANKTTQEINDQIISNNIKNDRLDPYITPPPPENTDEYKKWIKRQVRELSYLQQMDKNDHKDRYPTVFLVYQKQPSTIKHLESIGKLIYK